MTLNDLINRGVGIVPEADENYLPSISTTQLCKRDIFNDAQDEFVKITRALPSEKKFDCTANNPTYLLSTVCPDFNEMRAEGVWHLRSSSSTSWDRLEPTTIRNLDQTNRTWRDMSANDFCRWYYQDGNTIGVYYTPSTSVTNGFNIYYYASPSDMSSLTDHPFSSNGLPHLEGFERILITYYEYRVLGLLGYKDDSSVKEKEFYQLCQAAKQQLDSRRDLAQTSQGRVRSNLNFYKSAFRG